jgi:glyoxylase-like metal-dependent hydrolase (beta-lactamase superfamily II)
MPGSKRLMEIQHFFHTDTNTLTYVVWDEASRDTVVIDPVLDYDPNTSRLTTKAVQEVVAFIRAHDLRLCASLETHVHADHFSGGQWLRDALNSKAPIVIGSRVTEVQKTFRPLFGWSPSWPCDGSQFDRLLHDNEVAYFGHIALTCLSTPGHTPACCTYMIDDALFVGDTIFAPDFGSGRCDFPGGDAKSLYTSIKRLYTYPDTTRIFLGHDYPPATRGLIFETTVGIQKLQNKHVKSHTTEEEFVAYRAKRDAELTMPRLIFQSLNVNLAGGYLPEPEYDGGRVLRIPLLGP